MSDRDFALLGLRPDASLEEVRIAYARAVNRYRRHLARGNPLPIEKLEAMRQASRRLLGAADLPPPAPRPKAMLPPLDVTLPGTNQAAPPSSPDAAQPPVSQPEFRGQGTEYFRIWLVNLLLTLLTLGLYSAWAKVRREQYFHRHLLLDGSAFDYHGQPRTILRGRLLLLPLLLLSNLGEAFPLLQVLGTLAFMLALPWLLVQSLRFRAHNLSYRGLRFAFAGTYREAVPLYLGHGLLVGLSLGFYLPAFLRQQKAFVARNLRYGRIDAQFNATVRDFYLALRLPLLLWGGLVLLALLIALTGIGEGGLAAALLAPLATLLFLLLRPWLQVVGSNLFWTHLQLGETRFVSHQTLPGFLKLSLGNSLLTLLTLGLYWPYARIRLARYRAEHLQVINAAALATATAAAGQDVAAFGSEAAEGLDLGIGL
ncbi:MAG: hypothetical protein RIR00_2320 [Pseudomonadota bacterium]|jgi:uncharacterized membrane protein YjgN (DUF898 family)